MRTPARAFEGSNGRGCRRCQCPCGYGYVIVHTYIPTSCSGGHTPSCTNASPHNTHTQPHTATHSHKQPHTDTHRHTQTHTDTCICTCHPRAACGYHSICTAQPPPPPKTAPLATRAPPVGTIVSAPHSRLLRKPHHSPPARRVNAPLALTPSRCEHNPLTVGVNSCARSVRLEWTGTMRQPVRPCSRLPEDITGHAWRKRLAASSQLTLPRRRWNAAAATAPGPNPCSPHLLRCLQLGSPIESLTPPPPPPPKSAGML